MSQSEINKLIKDATQGVNSEITESELDLVRNLRHNLKKAQDDLRESNCKLLAALEIISIQATMLTDSNRQIKDLQVANNQYWNRIINQGI